jgi:hypothetical protein
MILRLKALLNAAGFARSNPPPKVNLFMSLLTVRGVPLSFISSPAGEENMLSCAVHKS